MLEKEEVKTKEFWLTKPAYLRQVGQMHPEYVDASPAMPVRVVLPAKIERVIYDDKKQPVLDEDGQPQKKLVDQREHPHMRHAPPAKLKPAHSEVKKDPVRKSHEPAKGQEAVSTPGGDGKRAADK